MVEEGAMEIGRVAPSRYRCCRSCLIRYGVHLGKER